MRRLARAPGVALPPLPRPRGIAGCALLRALPQGAVFGFTLRYLWQEGRRGSTLAEERKSGYTKLPLSGAACAAAAVTRQRRGSGPTVMKWRGGGGVTS